MRSLSILLLTLAVAPIARAQAADSTAHRVPFASVGNALELAIATPAGAALSGISVALVGKPAWLTVTPASVALDALTSGEEAVAAFAFDVDRAAPVGEPGEVVFRIEAGGQAWTKAVRLRVEAPHAVALHPSYPNPAGGRATLAFELPEAARVHLAVYDVLGRRVAVLVDGEQAPGRHEAVLEGAASGLYVARLVVGRADGTREAKTRRLTVVR